MHSCELFLHCNPVFLVKHRVTCEIFSKVRAAHKPEVLFMLEALGKSLGFAKNANVGVRIADAELSNRYSPAATLFVGTCFPMCSYYCRTFVGSHLHTR